MGDDTAWAGGRTWGSIVTNQRRFVEHVFFVIFLAIVCRDLFGYISSSMQGNGKEDGREILRTIYDGGSNMIFDREKISGFEWI